MFNAKCFKGTRICTYLQVRELLGSYLPTFEKFRKKFWTLNFPFLYGKRIQIIDIPWPYGQHTTWRSLGTFFLKQKMSKETRGMSKIWIKLSLKSVNVFRNFLRTLTSQETNIDLELTYVHVCKPKTLNIDTYLGITH